MKGRTSETRRRGVSGRLRPWEASALVLAALAAAPAGAQQAVPADADSPIANGGAAGATVAEADGLADIVITARYRRENLQQTPLAITALTGAQLESRGYLNIADVSRSSPNVTIQQASNGNGRAAQAIIRGVGQSDFNYALEPGVGMYIDDVYFSTVFGSLFDILDVDRVEVLRGPQGTLFGKNTEGGAVRIYSVKPTGSGGYVEAGLGNYGQRRLRGAFDLPLVEDTLFLRVSGGLSKMDGFMDILDFACVSPAQAGSLKPSTTAPGCKVGELGGSDTKTLRAQLRWLPTSDLEINLAADLLDQTGDAAPDKLLYIDPNISPTLAAYNATVAMPTYGIAVDQRFLTNSPHTTYADFRNPTNGLVFPNVSSVRDRGVSATINWKASDWLSVKSVTGYRRYTGEFSFDQGGSPLPVAMNYNDVSHHQFSQELNLTGKLALGTRSIEWTVGGYYFDGKSRNGGTIDLPTSGIAFDIDDPAENKNRSAFLHLLYHATDELSFEAGYRYSHENKSYTFYRLIQPIKAMLFPVTKGEVSYGRSDYKLGAQYQWTPHIMTYVSYATGFKAGGLNPRPLGPSQVQSFEPEELTSYEFGAKTDLFDRRLRLNGAIFRSDYKNLQREAIGLDNDGLIAILYKNVGKARISGFEFEADAEPIPHFLLNGSLSYLHYRTLDLGSAAGVSGGPTLTSQPPDTPKWQWSVGAQYRIKTAIGDFTPRLDYAYRSKTYPDAPNTPFLAEPGYGLLNARLGWTAPDATWSAAFTVQNLTDELYYVNKAVRLDFGTVDGQPGLPRTFLFTVRRKF